MLMVRFEISNKMLQVRFYDEDPDKYDACFQLYVDGKRAFLYSLMGNDFYRRFAVLLPSIMDQCEIDSIEASVSQKHLKIITRFLEKIVDVKNLGTAIVAGREMMWIKLERKPLV